jgi:hypothetical protein
MSLKEREKKQGGKAWSRTEERDDGKFHGVT